MRAHRDDDGCAEQNKFVYAVDTDGSFYRFRPLEKQFELVGVLNCQAGGATPFSMAVDRDGTAWVLHSTSFSSCAGIYAVDTETAECTGKTPFQCGNNNFSLFGMGYATDGSDTSDETLYIGSTGGLGSGGRLGALDTDTWTANAIGSMPAGGPEFTGNALGELWGFFPQTNPPKIAQIDKSTGQELVTWPLNDLSSSANAWAFAFWGGDFYIFYKTTSNQSTNVWKVSNGTLQLHMQNTGKRIVGAGVSTCAPIDLE